MEIKTKYNVNDKIAVKDYKDNIILTTISRIETYATDTNLDIKYITNYGVINENQTININEFLNELNNINTKKKDNPIEIIPMTFTSVDKSVKSKYHIGQLVEYNNNVGDSYIDIIESVDTNNENVIYKLKNNDKHFLEKEIRFVEFEVGDSIIYFINHEADKTKYYIGTITSIYFDHVVIRDNKGCKINVLYDKIVKRK